MVLPNDVDLINPTTELEKWRHKLKPPFPSDLFLREVKCQSCFNNNQSQTTAVMCGKCQTVLCQPSGGRPSLGGGCSCDRTCRDVCTLPNRVPRTHGWLCKTGRMML